MVSRYDERLTEAMVKGPSVRQELVDRGARWLVEKWQAEIVPSRRHLYIARLHTRIRRGAA